MNYCSAFSSTKNTRDVDNLIDKCNEAIELVKAITFEPEGGMEFDAVGTRMMTFGAFVAFSPEREGLVHISELEQKNSELVSFVSFFPGVYFFQLAIFANTFGDPPKYRARNHFFDL